MRADAASRYGGGLLLAKKGPAKKKKAKEDDDFGPPDIAAVEDNDSGVGVHREQVGVDTPYKSEVGGRGDIGFLSEKVGDADASSSTDVDIDGSVLFIFGRFEMGPELSVSYVGAKTAEKADSTTLAAAVGGIFKVNFGNIDHALLVPFAYGGVAYKLAQVKVGDADAAKDSGYIAKIGGGLDMFLTSNVAINPGLEYRMESSKGDGSGAQTTTKSGIHLLGGFAIFL